MTEFLMIVACATTGTVIGYFIGDILGKSLCELLDKYMD